MITVRLKGGLGNQMFQYALGRVLARKHNVGLKLDIQGLKSRLHTYAFDLQHFNIQCEVATTEEVMSYRKKNFSYYLLASLDRLKPYYKRRNITERTFDFDPEVLKVSSDVYLQGYWQSASYFCDYRDVIVKELSVKYPVSGKNLEITDSMNASDSVSLHIRRGDYVNIPEVNSVHGTCPLDYYYRCLDILNNKLCSPSYYIFSDDIPWVRKNLKINAECYYVDHNGIDKCYEDLRLISACKHNIIANSTFSWWGAWLNQNPGKMVFAPRRWAVEESLNTRGRIPEDWIQI